MPDGLLVFNTMLLSGVLFCAFDTCGLDVREHGEDKATRAEGAQPS